MTDNNSINLSVVIPVYNEQDSIKDFSFELLSFFKEKFGDSYEILFVNDGSLDNSLELLKKIIEKEDNPNVKLIENPYNMGYGATLKNGMRHATGKWIGIIDADMTYPVGKFKDLWEGRSDADMVVASRTGESVSIPFVRRPAKWFITKLACYLANFKIKDLNSGLRIFKKDVAMEFFGLFPSGFSLTTTITLACLTNDYRVKYLPINYHERVGESSIRPHHFFDFIFLIFRIVMYFKPLKFFVWPALLLIIGGLGLGIYEIIEHSNIPDSSVLLVLGGLQFLFLGIIADLITKSRLK